MSIVIDPINISHNISKPQIYAFDIACTLFIAYMIPNHIEGFV